MGAPRSERPGTGQGEVTVTIMERTSAGVAASLLDRVERITPLIKEHAPAAEMSRRL